MVDTWFLLSTAAALFALWMAGYMAPRWALKARIHDRLKNRGGIGNHDEEMSSFLAELGESFTSLSSIQGDYEDMEAALETTGRNRQQSQATYMVLCWLLPLIVIVLGFIIAGSIVGIIIAAVAFLLPRRVIRTMGVTAEKQQNLEAIELCHMTRMLMEAGLSIERALRLTAVQARPIMPHLASRLDRFNRVMESGADRTAALDELGRNRRIVVLRSYVNLMKQSGTLGAGVTSSLDQIIKEAQQKERSNLNEETNRIGAKMTIVMMVFLLPGLFLLIGGPAVMSILETISR
ncbi:type II secretion system protein-like protein [Marinobacter lipolyticus SM19]|uniref:Type II secretion system protein-like protein n=1 Tax=Marinobacter lipolyticus SM19 TaxID=1318628 RepID=R8AY52_9GAMM|nr:type II secretion system F family protein [Marinobacter lipolyticus]EON91266.1 type II secretion system protein-like protein [Marinobacter lipolyticus SM19]